MEHHAQSVGDALIGGLSYKLKAGAPYVTDRRSVSFFASGGNQYSSTGVKVMRFNLSSDRWMDPSTFRIMFQLNNKVLLPMALILFYPYHGIQLLFRTMQDYRKWTGY